MLLETLVACRIDTAKMQILPCCSVVIPFLNQKDFFVQCLIAVLLHYMLVLVFAFLLLLFGIVKKRISDFSTYIAFCSLIYFGQFFNFHCNSKIPSPVI